MSRRFGNKDKMGERKEKTPKSIPMLLPARHYDVFSESLSCQCTCYNFDELFVNSSSPICREDTVMASQIYVMNNMESILS